ncbi:CopD family protein [Maribacter sp. 2307ULW6-5]|uniref:CopD family protein n=1 Tax=Maribacter sp. 2307ULW6-5 TaxID=3386275 RepID=UPI0039BD8A64
MLQALVFLHLIAATIWTGGHLILALRYLPKALKKKDFGIIEAFEKQYEPIGLPSLLVLAATGIYFATQYAPDFFVLDLGDHHTRHVAIKLGLLLATVLLALHARLVLIPKRALQPLAVHIIAVTVLSVAFVFVGFSARSGGLL